MLDLLTLILSRLVVADLDSDAANDPCADATRIDEIAT